jgi:hypothetical protein
MDKAKTRTITTRKIGKLDHNHERARITPHTEHRATHSAVMDKEPSPECPICAVNLTTDDILWQCKETETKRLQTGITKEIWKGGRQEMEKLIKYVKEIEFFDGI